MNLSLLTLIPLLALSVQAAQPLAISKTGTGLKIAYDSSLPLWWSQDLVHWQKVATTQADLSNWKMVKTGDVGFFAQSPTMPVSHSARVVTATAQPKTVLLSPKAANSPDLLNAVMLKPPPLPR